MLKFVSLIAIGGAAAQCGGNIPLFNQLGNRLFCGVGLGSVICPARSYCELSTGFCCPGVLPLPLPTITVINPLPPLVNVVAKCQTGSPWKNALGIEYMCGPGFGHSDCPLGSECITGPGNVFWACCALPPPPLPTIPPIVLPLLPALPPALPPAPLPILPAASAMVNAQCQFGVPLTDASGIQLFCGAGPNHVDCPVDYICITSPDNAFSACCSIAASASVSMSSQSSASETAVSDTSMTTTAMSNTGSSMSNTGSSMSNTGEPSGEWSMADTDSSMSADAVRFLNLRLLDPTEAIAMWAPPNGTMPESYTAEISYDGKQWRLLSSEQPDSTFITFPVTEMKQFWFRVTFEGGSPAMETFTPQKMNGGKRLL